MRYGTLTATLNLTTTTAAIIIQLIERFCAYKQAVLKEFNYIGLMHVLINSRLPVCVVGTVLVIMYVD
jgi:hypothetical protein